LIKWALRSRELRGLYELVHNVPGLGYLAVRMVRHLVPKDTYQWTTVPAGLDRGLEILADPRYELRYLRGDHEPWMQDLLKSWLEPGDAFYDVGAHVGFFTLGAARLVGPQGRVVALEPDAHNYERLQSSVERSKMPQIRLVSAAAWSRRGTALFEPSHASSSRVEGRLSLDAGPQKQGDRVSVPTVLLDSYFEAGPCVVKVDVEGAEAQVLKGADRFLNGDQTKWVIELHSDESRRELFKLLEQTDYEISVVAPTHPKHSSKGQNYIVAVPKV